MQATRMLEIFSNTPKLRHRALTSPLLIITKTQLLLLPWEIYVGGQRVAFFWVVSDDCNTANDVASSSDLHERQILSLSTKNCMVPDTDSTWENPCIGSLTGRAKKEVTVLVGVIDHAYQDEINLLLHNRSKEEHAGNTGDSLGPGDSRQRRHTGRQRDSFGRRGCFAGAPAQRFPVRSIRDGWARLVPSPQGKRQLEALRTESFTASTANPGRSGSVGNGRPPKEN
ncbi:hypothetical protein AAY473_005889 [Plecturocebus cupreus]